MHASLALEAEATHSWVFLMMSLMSAVAVAMWDMYKSFGGKGKTDD